MINSELLSVPPGLKGVLVADTRIGSVRGVEGYYHYRQYNATTLVRTRSLEDIWELVVDGSLPEPNSSGLASIIAEGRAIPKLCIEHLRGLVALGTSNHHALLSALPYLVPNSRPTLDSSNAEQRKEVLRICSAFPTLLATIEAMRVGRELPLPNGDASHAADWLAMASGNSPSEQKVAAVESYLSATIDHGFNASTFAVRVVTSTGADVVSAIAAGLGALSGPLHGGAPSRALAMIREIGDPRQTEAWVSQELDRGRKIMGFGHAVYKNGDPRSALLREVALGFDSDIVSKAVEIEMRILEVMRKRKPNATIATNVEYYAGIVLHLAGLPSSMFTPSFMVSRVIGWGAHLLEQAANNKIIRPSARYVGPDPSDR